MPHKTVIIETTATTLTALEVSGGSGSPEISRWASAPVPPEGLTPGVVREFWRQEKFSVTRAVWVIPETLIRYQKLSFMVLPEEQLTAAVKLEMDNSTGSGELWRVIGSRRHDGQVSVQVAVIANQQLTRTLELFNQAGLTTSWSGLYSQGIRNFILFHQDLFASKPGRFAFLYLTEERTEYGVATEETILYRRAIMIGSRALTQPDAEAAQTDWLGELRLSVASGKSSGQSQTDALWLFGTEVTELPKIQKILVTAGLTPILPVKTNLSGVVTQTMTPRLAPLVGLALDEVGWNGVENLRFYTLEQQRQQMIAAKLRWLLRWGVVAGILLLGGWFLVRAQLLENRAERHWLAERGTKLARLRRVEAETQANLQKIMKLEQWSNGKGAELEFMLALQKRLPPGTVITDLTIEAGKVKNLTGTTPLVSLLLTRLGADPRLRVLELKGNIMTTVDGREGFQLEEADVPKEQKKQ